MSKWENNIQINFILINFGGLNCDVPSEGTG